MRPTPYLVIALISLSACGGDSTGPSTSVTGAWRSTVSCSADQTHLMTIVEDQNGSVAGNSAYNSGSTTIAGTHLGATVNLTFTFSYQVRNFTGTYEGGNTLTGSWRNGTNSLCDATWTKQ
jgi:hypothetical protein